jgi:glycosyltransferase involved in cell wall biosynthesis
MALPFVSVLTPTYNRRKFIPYAIECFKHQTYPQDRMEWLILDDGTDKIKDLIEKSGLKNVRYMEVPEGEKWKIGRKRNFLNDNAKGDICVCFDDDDYYPPDRVRKAVNKLRSSPGRQHKLVGASLIYLYFTDRDEIWSIGPYHPYHCTNGTMAYWREISKEQRYDETVDKAEESSFTRKFTTPALQMAPEDTMLVICHAHNTFDKRILLKQGNRLLKKQSLKLKQLVKEKKLRDFYLSLANDYVEKDAAAAAVPALTVSELSANEIDVAALFGADQIDTTIPIPGGTVPQAPTPS